MSVTGHFLEGCASVAIILGVWLVLLSLPPHDDAERDAKWREFGKWWR